MFTVSNGDRIQFCHLCCLIFTWTSLVTSWTWAISVVVGMAGSWIIWSVCGWYLDDSSLRSIQELFDICADFDATNCIVFSEDKTNYVCVSNKNSANGLFLPALCFNFWPPTFVSDNKYLGVFMHTNIRMMMMMMMVMMMMRHVINSLYSREICLSVKTRYSSLEVN